MLVFNQVWETVLIVFAEILLIRLSGRKTISEMSATQAVILISTGTLMIHPLVGNSLWITLITAAILLFTVILIEVGEIKCDKFEGLIRGKAHIIIENGVLNQQALGKHRLTVDELETHLRQLQIEKVSDVQWATLEPSGKVGFVLKEQAKPATKADIQRLENLINQTLLNKNAIILEPSTESNIFTEILNRDS